MLEYCFIDWIYNFSLHNGNKIISASSNNIAIMKVEPKTFYACKIAEVKTEDSKQK